MDASDKARIWGDVARRLDEHPAAPIPCPFCGGTMLSVMDVPADPPSTALDRWLTCPNCRETTVLSRRRRRPF